MKYLSKSLNEYLDNHFKHFPDRSTSSRCNINDKISSYYNAKRKRFHVHRNDARKTGKQDTYCEHSTGIVRTLTHHGIQYFDLRRYANARELADYHGFPKKFILPKLKVLDLFGNAISVPVAEHILKLCTALGPPKTMLDLCAGIGGFHCAAKLAFPNIKCLGFSEIKKAAIDCYKQNFPEVPNLGDVRTALLPKADLLCAGFPCQPFSTCNTTVANHKFTGMFKHILDAVDRTNPNYVVLENVRPILRSPIFKNLERWFQQKDYEFNYKVLNSKDFGLKQDRYRVYMYAVKAATCTALSSATTDQRTDH